MKWVTRNHVHVDRVACPWLIKRFIDNEAEFLFIKWPAAKINSSMGIPFDFPGESIKYTHRNNKCTFEVLIEEYGLKDPILHEMAKVIHSADISKDMEFSSEAAGVELVSSGLIWISKDDHEAIEKGMILYDALYAGLKLRYLKQKYSDVLKALDREDRYELIRTRWSTPLELE